MAVKRSVRKTSNLTVKSPERIETIEHLAEIKPARGRINSGKIKIAAGVILVIVLLAGFWYKTNSWPILAMVGTRPVTRFEVAQELIKQYGKDAVENKITEMLVRNELNKLKVNVTSAEINTKIDEIKSSLGQGADLNKLLTDRGMTVGQFQDQVSLQLRVEKALSDKISITDQEVTDYLKTNQQFITASGAAALTQARDSLKYSKLQSEVGTWVQGLVAKAKVWRAPGL